MSRSIHASIEYSPKHAPGLVMSFAEINPGVSYSDIFVALGSVDGKPAAVPLRGYPKDSDGFVTEMGWIADRQLTVLVDRTQTEPTLRESDGLVISDAEAQDWMRRFSNYLPQRHDRPTNRFYRITDPDIHHVNWITADELATAIEAAGNGHLGGYKAALAAMRTLEEDENVSMVRFVYGFDN